MDHLLETPIHSQTPRPTRLAMATQPLRFPPPLTRRLPRKTRLRPPKPRPQIPRPITRPLAPPRHHPPPPLVTSFIVPGGHVSTVPLYAACSIASSASPPKTNRLLPCPLSS